MTEIIIDPRQNGVHSLAMALEAFNKLHLDPSDAFSLKDSIMRADHSIETLSKDVVFQIDPALLLKGNQKNPIECLKKGYINYFKGHYSTILDDCQTIGLEESLVLLRDLKLIKIDNDDFEFFIEHIKQLRLVRNKIQHLGISADPERVKRILGNTIPQSIAILQGAYDRLCDHDRYGFRFQTISIMDYLKTTWPDAETWLDTLKMEYCDLIIVLNITNLIYRTGI
jgi:hypothetical protein